MRLWSSKAATPHCVTRRQDLDFLCSGLAYRPSGFLRTPPAFLLTKALDHSAIRMQVHPERGLGTQKGGLVQLGSQEVE